MDSVGTTISVVGRTGDSYDCRAEVGMPGGVLEGSTDLEDEPESGRGGCSVTGVIGRSCFSTPSLSRGVAIPAPGVLIGNSSSSAVGIGIGPEIFPRIEDVVFVRDGVLGLQPAPLNLLILRVCISYHASSGGRLICRTIEVS
jgi:hypothetical protein